MSLEKAVADLTSAVEENTEVLKQVLENQKTALGVIKTAKKPAKAAKVEEPEEDDEDEDDDVPPKRPASKTTKKPVKKVVEVDEDDEDEEDDADDGDDAEDDEEEEDEEEEDETPAQRRKREKAEAAAKPAPKAKGKAKGPTVDDVRALVGELFSTDDKELEAERHKFVSAMLDHFQVKQTRQIAADDVPQAIEWLNKKLAGKKVRFV